MTVLADHQIRGLCEVPFAMVKYPVGNGFHRSVTTRPLYVPYGRTYEQAANMLELLIQNEAKYVDDITGDCLTYFKEVCSKTPINTVESPIKLFSKDEWEKRVAEFKPMISPFVPHQVRTRAVTDKRATDGIENDTYREEKILSYGTSSAGYDVRLADEFAIFTNISSVTIDPLNFDERTLHRVKAGPEGYVVLPPNSYLLGHTVEFFNIPRDVLVVCVGKSTYARAGCVINVTPIEPGFSGTVVIEVANTTTLPMKIYSGMGIAQFLFFKSSEPCRVSYGDRHDGAGGKYQNQTGLTLPKG